MNIKCQSCGREVNNCKFCPYCGTKVQSDDIFIIGLILIIVFPLVGVIYCLIKKAEEPRLKKVLMWYGIITVIAMIIGVSLLWFILSGIVNSVGL